MARLRLSEAGVRYVRHMEARQFEQSTIKGVQSALKLMREVIGDILLDSIKGEHIDRVFNHYPWGPGSRNNRIAQYKAFFAWCRSNRHMNPLSDPMAGWRQRALPDKAQLRIPYAEWPRLFEACQHPQERIVVATGLYLFLRASEQQDLRIGDVKLSENVIELWRRKPKKTQVMPISTELDQEIRTWLTFLSTQHDLQPEQHFICARNKDMHTDPVTHRWVAGTGTMNPNRPVYNPARIVQRVLSRAGYPHQKGQGEHTLRRSGARAYFDHLVGQGYDGALRQVQALLGHRNGATTERYLGITLEQRKVLEALAGKPMFPVGVNVAQLRGARHG